MTTFGPVQIAADTDDGQEANDTTWDVDGLDADGDIAGDRAAVSYDMGMRWDGVTIPPGATITSAFVELYCQFAFLSGALLINWVAIDEDDTATFGTGDRPSQRAQTTAIPQSMTVDDGGVFNSSVDLAAAVQTVIDRAGWASGNALGIVCKDNGNAASERAQFIDYAQSPTNSAKLTIEYTAASGELVTVTPGVGTVVISGQAPDIRARLDKRVSPGVGTVLISGSAPTVLTQVVVGDSPGAGALLVAGAAPTLVIRLNRTESPGAGTIHLFGMAPKTPVLAAVSPGAGVIKYLSSTPTVAKKLDDWASLPSRGGQLD
jgi:hypothetical protein